MCPFFVAVRTLYNIGATVLTNHHKYSFGKARSVVLPLAVSSHLLCDLVKLLVHLPVVDQLLDGPVVARILEVSRNCPPELLIIPPVGFLDRFVPLLVIAIALDTSPENESTECSDDDSLLFCSHFNPFGCWFSLQAMFMLRKLYALLLRIALSSLAEELESLLLAEALDLGNRVV